MNISKIIKYVFLALAFMMLLYFLTMPFRGESTFAVTTLYYAILFIIPAAFVLYRALKVNNYFLLYLSTIFSLFCAEIVLRYIVKTPITYSERQWGEYRTIYDSPNDKISFLEKMLFPENTYHYHLMGVSSLRDYETPEFNYTKEYTNSLGLRGKLPTQQKKTVISLGDSFTESFGAPSDSTYPVLLEKFITKVDTLAEVINGGVSGSDPFFEFNLLRKLNNEHHFQTAIFMINTSDINDVMMRGDTSRFLEDGSIQFRQPPFWEPLYAISFVFRLMVHNCGFGYNLMRLEEENAEKRAAIRSIVELFRLTIIPWSKHEGVLVKVVLQPMLPEISNDYVYYEELNNELKKIDMDYLNLKDSLIHYENPQELYWLQDGHFKAQGYFTTARIIFNTFFRDHN